MAKQKFYRQGDIYFVQVDKVDNSSAGKEVKDGIIARGEVTGHAHRIAAAAIMAGAILKRMARSNEMVLTSSKPITINHEEHGTIVLPKGAYKVLRQIEYDPLAPRVVQD